jgi:autotransporter translocation and assembly factor TamB
MANPFMIAGAFISAVGALQAGNAEARRQAAIAAQQEQNKKFEKLRALQDHNARLDSFERFVSTTNAVSAINNRAQSDRSIAALKKAGKERSKEELDRTRVQSLFTQGRMQFAADDARFAGSMARQQALISAATSIASMGYRMEQVTPEGGP